jgi:hypothetical protein
MGDALYRPIMMSACDLSGAICVGWGARAQIGPVIFSYLEVIPVLCLHWTLGGLCVKDHAGSPLLRNVVRNARVSTGIGHSRIINQLIG